MAAGVLSGALGQLADTNILASSTVSGGAWSPTLPLSNIVANATAPSPRHVGAPARCVMPGNLAASQMDIHLGRNYGVNLVGVLFHTLQLSARYRISTVGFGGDLDAPDYVSEWRKVYGRLSSSSILAWEAHNWWTGQVTEADLDLYPRHLWIPLNDEDGDVRVAGDIRIEFDDVTNTDGFIDVGGVFVASSFMPQFNFDRGRVLGAEDRSKSEESPSGRIFPDVRRPRRTHAVTWSFLDKAEAYAFFDMTMRAGTTRTMLFVPDLGDPIGLQREAFPATFAAYAAPRFNQDHQYVVSATLREIIA